METGEFGGTLPSGRVVKGFETLTTDYLWHVENNLWQYPKEVYTNNGIINL